MRFKMKKPIDDKIKICTKCGSTSLQINQEIGTCKDCGSMFFYNLMTAIFFKINQRFKNQVFNNNWCRTYGNEHLESDKDLLVKKRDMSANDIPILESQRRVLGMEVK